MDRAEAEAIYDAGRDVCVQFILDLASRVERLEERLRRLEEQARQDSRTSSKPPSSDPPTTRQQRRAEARAKAKELLRGERKAGGQPGHRGSGRELKPEDQVDEIVAHYPHACRGCGREFTVDERRPAGRFGRHQVAELPAISVVVVEHRTHRLRCPDCHAKTTAELPDGIGCSAFGPNLQAAVVTLTARNRISRRDMTELAGELFGAGLSVGAVDAICQRASDALELPHERLTQAVLCSPAVNVDETGWSTWGEQRTLWTATTPDAAVFRVACDRHRDRLEELIGKDFPGIVCSDRWWAYQHLDPDCRQVCWEHLKRDFRYHAEGHGEQKTFGEQGLELTMRLFAAWHAFAAHGDRRRLRRELKPIQRELRTLLQRAGRKSARTRHHRVFANKLLGIWPALWTFATVDGVQPTNNAAERSLRGPVIHRKLSHGTRSDDGERFIERALAASVTCRLRRRSLYAYLRELLTAQSRGQPLPTLA
jgi:transposase